MAIPSKLPRWANGGSASISEPPEATKTRGWQALDVPPNGWINWFWNLVYQWISYFRTTGGAYYVDLQAAHDDFDDSALAAGNIVVIDETDLDVHFGTMIEDFTLTFGCNPYGAIDTAGDLVVVTGGSLNPKGYDRDLNLLVTYSRTNTGTNYCIVTDGAITVASYDNYVEAFNATTGTSLWVFDNDAPIGDMAISGSALYIVGALTGGGGDATANRHCHRLNLVTGAKVWSYRHSAAGELRSVCTNGRSVFVQGTVSSYASGATIRALRASDGYDVDNEGGSTGAEGGIYTWNDVDATVHGFGRMLCTDGERLYIGNNDSSTWQISARSCDMGMVLWETSHLDATLAASDVTCDQDYVYVAYTDDGSPALGYIECYDKRTGGWVRRISKAEGSADYQAFGVVTCDGFRVFAVGWDVAEMYSFQTAQRPTRCRVLDILGDTDAPYRRLTFQPVEGS